MGNDELLEAIGFALDAVKDASTAAYEADADWELRRALLAAGNQLIKIRSQALNDLARRSRPALIKAAN